MADQPQTGGTQSGGNITPSADAVVVDGSTSEVTLPEGFSFGNATFEPSGQDLVLTAPDGKQVVVENFFATDNPPELQTAEGGKLAGDVASRLAGPQAPGQTAQAGPQSDAQPIGQVESASGTVTAIRADGSRVELQVGDPVFQGDIIQSADDGAIGVVLADETTFSMAEGGRMVLDEMVYDPGTQEGNISMSVLQGVFTFVSGQVAKVDPDAMVLNTPVATIGIRGTQVALDLTPGEEMKVVLMTESDGFVGEVVITNNGGVQILNVPNQGTSVASASQAPNEPRVFDRAEITRDFGSALEKLPTEVGTGNNYGVNDQETKNEEAEENPEAEIETAAGGEEEATEAEDAPTEALQEEQAVAGPDDEGQEEQAQEDGGDDDAPEETTQGEDLADV